MINRLFISFHLIIQLLLKGCWVLHEENKLGTQEKFGEILFPLQGT